MSPTNAIEASADRVRATASEGGSASGSFRAAGVIGFLAHATVTATAILVLDIWLPVWAAALLVTIVHATTAGVLALQTGRGEGQTERARIRRGLFFS